MKFYKKFYLEEIFNNKFAQKFCTIKQWIDYAASAAKNGPDAEQNAAGFRPPTSAPVDLWGVGGGHGPNPGNLFGDYAENRAVGRFAIDENAIVAEIVEIDGGGGGFVRKGERVGLHWTVDGPFGEMDGDGTNFAGASAGQQQRAWGPDGLFGYEIFCTSHLKS